MMSTSTSYQKGHLDDGEEAPLLGDAQQNKNKNGHGRQGQGQGQAQGQGQGLVVFGLVVAAIILAGITITIMTYHVRQVEAEQAAQASVRAAEQAAQAAAKKEILYRPVCELHSSSSSSRYAVALATQTSMKDPSHAWSAVACSTVPVPAPLPVQQEQEQPEINSDSRINAYQAPDATLAVQFDTLAYGANRPAILGFGGAFTEAAARNFQTLTAAGQEAVVDLLFGADGLGYTLGRMHMNSCDFSVASYSFDDVDGDFDLTHFDVGVHHDVEVGMVDFARRAVSRLRMDWGDDAERNGSNQREDAEDAADNDDDDTADDEDDDDEEEEEADDAADNDSDQDTTTTAATSKDGILRLYASPWSPPAWMKKPTWQDKAGAEHAHLMTFSTQPSCLRDGTGKDSPYAAAWALYFSKYLTAYSNLGLPFWAVTVQNEPEFPAPWEACAYSPRAELDFVKYHLGPQLEADHPDVKLLIFDHNKDHVNTWAKMLLNETNGAAQYVDGTSYHWYAGGMDRLLDGALGTANMHRLQAYLTKLGDTVASSHLVIGSEACHCPSTGYAGGDINVYWARAERYAHAVLSDLAAGSHGWVEWNLILDGIGGPNHLGNLCESTILAVPHRAIDATPDIPPLPSFEAHRPMGNVSIGDGRTREELNALGFPAKYLDVGVAVQPMYYYMGHISRHVRPGSRAVPNLVHEPLDVTSASDSSQMPPRIFRPPTAVVAGGGINDLARDGIEVTVWPCEGSTRQQFEWKDGVARNQILVRGHDWLGYPTTSCLGRTEDVDLKGVRLVACSESKHAGVFAMTPEPNDPHGRARWVLQNPSRKNQKQGKVCLVIRELANNGGAHGPRGGAQVTFGSCNHPSSLWKIQDGEISSLYLAGTKNVTTTSDTQEPQHQVVLDTSQSVCMTTGWPFLQMGAFTSASATSKTVVILNEANDPANFALVDQNNDSSELLLTGSIPARSIQTFVLQQQQDQDGDLEE